MLKVTLSGVDAAFSALEGAISSELPKGLWAVTEMVAAEARISHPWINRTGDLEASIEGSEAAGSFFDDTLIASVDALMPYGSFLEDRDEFAYLGPAWDRKEPEAERLIDTSLSNAVHEAGWRT